MTLQDQFKQAVYERFGTWRFKLKMIYLFIITLNSLDKDEWLVKFEQGEKEHGPGFLTEVNHKNEMAMEVYDFISYTHAHEIRPRNKN